MLSQHPIRVVWDLVDSADGELTFMFSRYFHRPQSVLDEREVFVVRGEDVTEAWLQESINGLKDGWELAIGSRVLDSRGRLWQMPMIDLAADVIDLREFELLSRLIPASLWRTAALFHSGRSYHLYFRKLIKKGEWPAFMGRLLLANLPERKPITDTRWIGHRLIAGYGSLRWSANSQYHSKLPSRIEMPKI